MNVNNRPITVALTDVFLEAVNVTVGPRTVARWTTAVLFGPCYCKLVMNLVFYLTVFYHSWCRSPVFYFNYCKLIILKGWAAQKNPFGHRDIQSSRIYHSDANDWLVFNFLLCAAIETCTENFTLDNHPEIKDS